MIKFMLGSIPHQKLSFYHLSTQGRAGIKLGMLIRLRRIYNFLLFHANIIQLLHTFGNFLYDLFGLTYLSSAQCQFLFVACFCFAENPYKTKSKHHKTLRIIILEYL